MRPLIVLVLVLVAGIALFFALNLYPSDGEAPATAGPAAVTASQPAGKGESTNLAPVAGAGGNSRGVAEPVEPDPGGASATEVRAFNQGNKLTGFVTDGNKAPVAGATVKLTHDAMMGGPLSIQMLAGGTRSGKSVSVETDTAGSYVFQDVAPGDDYYLIVTHPDFCPVQESYVDVGERGEFRGPDVVLLPGSRLTGRVLDVAGNAVPSAHLSLESAFNPTFDQPNPDRVEADADAYGTYAFENVAAGQRVLMVSADGYGTQVILNNDKLSFEGKPGEEKSLDVTLDAGMPIVGQVVGPEGRGVGAARVVAIQSTQATTTSRGEGKSDDSGRFQIDDLNGGSYILLVDAEGYEQARLNRVAAGQVDVVIELKRLACVNGTALAAGGPLRDFDVQLRRTTANPAPGSPQIYENTELSASVRGGDGSFQVCGVSPGYYSALVTAKGYAPTSSEVFQVIDEQAPPPLRVVVSAGGRIRGRIVAPDGSPVGGALVRCADNVLSGSESDPFFANLFSGAATERKTRSDDKGAFELPALAPATYVVHVEHPRFASLSVRDLTVTEGSPVELGDVRVLAGGSAGGVVRDGSGNPVARASVQMISTDDPNGFILRARTDDEGRYSFEHVRPGSYKLSATRQSPSSSTDPFGAILDQQASEVAVSVSDGTNLAQDLSLGS